MQPLKGPVQLDLVLVKVGELGRLNGRSTSNNHHYRSGHGRVIVILLGCRELLFGFS